MGGFVRRCSENLQFRTELTVIYHIFFLQAVISLCETTNDGHIKKGIQMTWDTQGFFFISSRSGAGATSIKKLPFEGLSMAQWFWSLLQSINGWIYSIYTLKSLDQSIQVQQDGSCLYRVTPFLKATTVGNWKSLEAMALRVKPRCWS